MNHNHPFAIEIDDKAYLEAKKDKPKPHKGKRPNNPNFNKSEKTPQNKPHKKKAKR